LLIIGCQSSDLKKEINSLSEENENLKKQINELQEEIKNLNENVNNFEKDLSEQRDCFIKYQGINPEQYTTGQLIVGFKEDITEQDAENLIRNHELSIKNWGVDFSKFHWATIKVPAGEEIDYICLLEKNSDITHASLDLKTVAS